MDLRTSSMFLENRLKDILDNLGMVVQFLKVVQQWRNLKIQGTWVTNFSNYILNQLKI